MKKNRAFLSSSFSLPDICLRTRIDEYFQNDLVFEGITWSSIVRLSWKDSVYRSKPRNKTKNVCARVCVCTGRKKGGVPAFIRKRERIGGICVVEGEVGFGERVVPRRTASRGDGGGGGGGGGGGRRREGTR